MIILNVDGLVVALASLSQEASAQFLTGGAAFHEVLAALEKKQLPMAANAAKKALNSFDNAIRSFSTLGQEIQSIESRRIRDAIHGINLPDAARTVHLSPDSDIIATLNKELEKGNLHQIFAMFSQQLIHFSKRLSAFADRASGSNVILDDEYRLAHELLRDWGVLIDEGQYISSVCLAAATQRSVA